jgi:2,3-bisphosphoglycerate-independent phosphoglycerate mutase
VRPPGHGESQPRLDDDRLPVVLVVLDGLGDRPISELGGRTPSEAAHTPALDRLARRGASGWHLPFGWGRAPTSELAHWAMFGFSGVPFPGRAVLEAIGAGLDVPAGVAVTFAALRTSRTDDGTVWITGRAGRDDHAAADALYEELAPVLCDHGVRLHPLGRGEAVLLVDGCPRGDVTDSDPFFEDFHPWLRVRPLDPAAEDVATRLNALLLAVRERIVGSDVNRSRTADGLPPLDVLTTKWSGSREPIPTFIEQTGVRGAAVTSTRLYRGIAGLLGMTQRHLSPREDPAADMAARIDTAASLLDEGSRFVHVHTKATDEAGHSKMPRAKLEVLERLDPGLAGLEGLAERAVVAVTGDHATPSVDGVLHTADPTPLLVVGPTVRPDDVEEFGERPAHAGWYGQVRADELLPLLFGHANRPVFLGHRPVPRQTLALPDDPEPMPVSPGPATVSGAAGHRARGSHGPGRTQVDRDVDRSEVG